VGLSADPCCAAFRCGACCIICRRSARSTAPARILPAADARPLGADPGRSGITRPRRGAAGLSAVRRRGCGQDAIPASPIRQYRIALTCVLTRPTLRSFLEWSRRVRVGRDLTDKSMNKSTDKVKAARDKKRLEYYKKKVLTRRDEFDEDHRAHTGRGPHGGRRSDGGPGGTRRRTPYTKEFLLWDDQIRNRTVLKHDRCGR